MDSKKPLPYETLGTQLRRLRELHSESLAEVSGAVEIEEKELGRIESGQDRPSEDILLLLISHFGIQEERAAELWELAGYDKSQDDDHHSHRHDDDHQQTRTQTMMVMVDPRVMYSDDVEVNTSTEGVVLSFSQVAGLHGQPLTVARLGMSHAQARLLLGVLHQALYERDNPDRKRLGEGSK